MQTRVLQGVFLNQNIVDHVLSKPYLREYAAYCNPGIGNCGIGTTEIFLQRVSMSERC